uniref:Uncharacterized protein n=1 Tax=Dunaliella tertiolecta TaxID=3047 RepID=A0A7S3QN00_DUNTE
MLQESTREQCHKTPRSTKHPTNPTAVAAVALRTAASAVLHRPAQLHTPVPRFVPVPWLPAWPGSSMHSGPWADPPCRMLLLLLLQPLSAEVAVPAETPGP